MRRFPSLLASLERGEIHISALVLLRDHLTVDNHEELVRAASRKSKREVQELLAARFPKPDVPSTMRRLPTETLRLASMHRSTPSMPPSPSMPAQRFGGQAILSNGSLEPLSEARYKLQLTASAELRAKLERAIELMRHRNPTGDFAVVLDKALDLLVAKLESERLGKTTRPQKARDAKPGHVGRAVRREVFTRDGEQCTFVDEEGNRCPSRSFLELDHIHPRALGGDGSAANLRIRCRPHNALYAEQTFGRVHVEQRVHVRRNKSAARTESKDLLAEPTFGEARTEQGVDVCRNESAAQIESNGVVTEPTFGTARIGQEVDVCRNKSTASSTTTILKDGGPMGAFELASSGLMKFGFRASEARRALAVVRARVDASRAILPPVEEVLRQALAVLC